MNTTGHDDTTHGQQRKIQNLFSGYPGNGFVETDLIWNDEMLKLKWWLSSRPYESSTTSYASNILSHMIQSYDVVKLYGIIWLFLLVGNSGSGTEFRIPPRGVFVVISKRVINYEVSYSYSYSYSRHSHSYAAVLPLCRLRPFPSTHIIFIRWLWLMTLT